MNPDHAELGEPRDGNALVRGSCPYLDTLGPVSGPVCKRHMIRYDVGDVVTSLFSVENPSSGVDFDNCTLLRL